MPQRMAQHSPRKPDAALDLRGYRCPIPVLKARKRLAAMAAGEELEIVADDPPVQVDMPHFCTESGHALLSAVGRDGAFVFRIRKGAA
jgi:tRNA 2-thiouridine synthesizing protein A